jgi:hypothetical protein
VLFQQLKEVVDELVLCLVEEIRLKRGRLRDAGMGILRWNSVMIS